MTNPQTTNPILSETDVKLLDEAKSINNDAEYLVNRLRAAGIITKNDRAALIDIYELATRVMRRAIG